MIPIYVIHYPKLTERKEYIDTLGLNPRYVSTYSKDTLSDGKIAEIYNPSPEIWRQKTDGLASSEYRKLNSGDIACLLNHVEAYLHFSSTKSNVATISPFCLIFEDDFRYNGQNLKKDIDNAYTNIPDDADVIFLGGSFPHERLKTVRIENQNYHLKDDPATNCCFAYFISSNAAKILARNMGQITLPIDFELNYWFRELNLNVYHYIPYFITEGSATGAYRSSVR